MDDKCAIHAAKPSECRHYIHAQPDKVVMGHRHEIVRAWMAPEAQARIVDLLGREPEEAAPMSMLDALFSY